MTDSYSVGVDEIKSVFPLVVGIGITSGSNLKQATDDFEKKIILDTIKGAGNNMARAARTLGLERSHLYKKMKTLNIDRNGLEK